RQNKTTFHCSLLTAYCSLFLAEPAQFFLRLFIEFAVGVALDELRQIAPPFRLILLGGNLGVWLLLALLLRQIQVAHAGEPEHLVYARVVRIARDDLLAAGERSAISLAHVEVELRGFEILLRVALQFRIAQRRRVGAVLRRAALRARRRAQAKNSEQQAKANG